RVPDPARAAANARPTPVLTAEVAATRTGTGTPRCQCPGPRPRPSPRAPSHVHGGRPGQSTMARRARAAWSSAQHARAAQLVDARRLVAQHLGQYLVGVLPQRGRQADLRRGAGHGEPGVLDDATPLGVVELEEVPAVAELGVAQALGAV